MSDPKKEIATLIRAAYPLIYVVSYEEKRVEEHLKQIASEREKRFFVWSPTTGFVEVINNGQGSKRKQVGGEKVTDPMGAQFLVLDALDYVSKFIESAMFVFMDLHPFLNDPIIVRKLRELADENKVQKKVLVILSSVLKIPVELEKQVTVVDWPLPKEDEIEELLDNVVATMKRRGLDLNLSSEEREAITRSSLGMTVDEIDNVFSKSLVDRRTISLDVIIAEKQQIIRKSGILEFFPASESLSDVGGMSNLKTWLTKRGNAFTERAREFGLPQPKGVLLLGVQGCGKSLVCKASASLWKMPLLRFDLGKVFSGVVGSSEENIRKAIATAEAVSPCILWIDEIDKGASGVQSSAQSDAGTTARVFSTFLTWQQEKTAPVFTIATCNSIESLPAEILRKGRFDEIFFVDLPSIKERTEIFKIHLTKRRRDVSKFDLKKLAEAADNFSGAEIEQTVISGMFDAFDEDVEVSTQHILKAIEETIPLAITMKEEIEHLRKWATTRARCASDLEILETSKRERQIDLSGT
jgi:SpoVK/Ycf46/Vps4 family AAA+-type ATPase